MAKILWIDDKADSKNIKRMGFDGLVFFIEKYGHTVKIVSSRAAIESTLNNWENWDLVLLDIIMEPLINATAEPSNYGGFDVMAKLNEMKIHTPIIILSVVTTQEIKREAELRGLDLHKIGVIEIMRKGGIVPSVLGQTVENCLSAHVRSNQRSKEA